ncbi:IclR family transcriptional regulator [Paraburkholderia phenoliruptrix]|uniref:IclR family transcriptional regulator n=1 Tax=Paraburkholderia phenoliruptrix TaxID=252970 RepID=UPI001C6E9E46|nr:IclR family transcriptional regulator [Paraburkholderia phenoliruptrix]MBW9107436.1 IclR family transcriptional regulator [Paraburkholderia phenoliruptrix]MBW9128142.1 IclR family transcriptional regulator [Paraburkholderia ginsengiterrae]
MADTEKGNDSVRAVGRALEILLAFTPADFELSPAELLKRVDLSRPTLYRLLHTLEVNGFLVSSGDPQKFRLGSSVARLAHVWSSSKDPAAAAMPMMRRLREVTDETVGLYVRQDDYRLCIAEVPSTQPLSFRRGVGFQDRISLGASGKVILAHSSLEPRQLRQMTQHTGVDIAAFVKELDKAKALGYAISRDEQIHGATSVAVPFFDASGTVAGSLALYGPSVRFDAKRLERFTSLLLSESAHLSRTMGYQFFEEQR